MGYYWRLSSRGSPTPSNISLLAIESRCDFDIGDLIGTRSIYEAEIELRQKIVVKEVSNLPPVVRVLAMVPSETMHW